MEMKYVVVKSVIGEQMFIFPVNIVHADFVDVLSDIKHSRGSDWDLISKLPVSAGFTNGVTAYGFSESLGLGARPIDTELLGLGGVA